MRWYADNSELHGTSDVGIPDILLFGGIIIGAEDELVFRARLAEIKKKLGHPAIPVKWNFKDLRGLYVEHKGEHIHRSMTESMKGWRREIFSLVADTQCALLVSGIEAYSDDRAVVKRTKEKIAQYVFSNGLMRFGLHVLDKKPTSTAQVILDWPDAGKPQPFDREYRSAYLSGKSCEKVSYKCGPLHLLQFHDSVLYANSNHSELLQVADMIVGATRELIECSLGKRSPGQGVDCARLVRDKYRGAPHSIPNYGIPISNGSAEFKRLVGEGIKNLLYA